MADYAHHDEILRQYYDRRAPLLDRGYTRAPPEWVRAMVADMQRVLHGRYVLEVACGTGHWTGFAAQAAQQVVGIDVAPGMLALARQKQLPHEKVAFYEA